MPRHARERSDILTTVPLEGLPSVAIRPGVFAAVARDGVSVEMPMFTWLLVLILIGAVESGPALAGSAHPSVVSGAALLVVAEGMRKTGATQAAATLVGRQRSVIAAQFRLMAPVALLSAFINTTPVVSAYLALVRSSAQRIGVSPSKLLMPLGFASLLGGQLTLIGSAFNLIVRSMDVECLRAENLPALICPPAFPFRPEP